ncbi:histidine kinase [Suttonella sp. R2A3]|uniref:histidine kinase n=1 Tax=Suttonella sp. R2A3 TaxID=2908648 RepID=UPI001F468B56|nr:histidine kinase [Suttonella sp. R2A3]UJF25227.1 histidine kinase [Suttonella sp. R2A3]
MTSLHAPSIIPVAGFKSLSYKLLSTIFIWALCILVFVSQTVLITWRLEDRGVVINQMGNLNKQIYRLLLTSSREESSKQFTKQITLTREALARLSENVDSVTTYRADNTTVQHTLVDIEQGVDHFIVAATKAYQGTDNLSELMQQADILTTNINLHAQAIERDNTDNIHLLRIIRLCLIALILCSVAASFWMLRRWVINPLTLLNQTIDRLTQGQLSARLHLHSHDEFEEVAKKFNLMAHHLQDMYAHMEDKIAIKTHALLRQKQDWELLYQVTSYLHANTFGQETLQIFLEKILSPQAVDGGYLSLTDATQQKLNAAYQLSEPLLAKLHNISLDEYFASHCDDDDTALLRIRGDGKSEVSLWLLPVRYVNTIKGFLVLYLGADKTLSEENVRLLKLLNAQLAITHENAYLNSLHKQYAVLEERNLIARGLHDSIAQSLSFLNMQFQILCRHPNLSKEISLQENITLIQNGIHHCYEDVRELLNNFRTRIQYQSVHESIEAVIVHYQKQVGLPTRLYILSDEIYLDAAQQTQVIFILQEALSNIRKHSGAQNISVVIDNDGDFCMNIEDDGCGFDYDEVQRLSEAEEAHIGLFIMRERADQINATLYIDSSPGCGTRIRLIIPRLLPEGNS